MGTNTCGAAKYGRLTTDTSVLRALRLTDCTMARVTMLLVSNSIAWSNVVVEGCLCCWAVVLLSVCGAMRVDNRDALWPRQPASTTH